MLAFVPARPSLPAEEREELQATYTAALPDAAARAALGASASDTTLDELCTRSLAPS